MIVPGQFAPGETFGETIQRDVVDPNRPGSSRHFCASRSNYFEQAVGVRALHSNSRFRRGESIGVGTHRRQHGFPLFRSRHFVKRSKIQDVPFAIQHGP
jgi:hypothetical protein